MLTFNRMLIPTRNQKTSQGPAKLLRRVVAVTLFTLIGLCQHAAAQGVISGTIVDADFGGGVSGSLVSLIGTDLSTKSDLEGRFIISGVPEGEYTMIVSASFYKSSTVRELLVADGDVARIDVPLYGDDSDIVELEGYTVTAKVLEGSEIGLLAKRQKSASVGDAIGAESFSRLGLGDAADAMSKVTGASVVDGKYVVMRGLSDRYNNTTLNGASVPSSDPDRKAVQLDQFPSGLIDVISTSKTFTPDKSGEFTGGSVDIQTKAFPDQFFLNVSFGVGYSEGTTGSSVLTYPGGGQDWFGQDDGTRAFPELARDPENLTDRASPEVRDELIRSLSPDMSPERGDAPLDTNWSVAFGNNSELFGKRFGYVASLTYSRDYSHVEDGVESRYETRLNTAGRWLISTEEDFEVDKTVETVNVGTLLNLSYQVAENHEIGLKNFYSQSGTDIAAFHEGTVVISEDIFLRESRLHYTERNVLSSQFYGKHQLAGLGDTKLEWDFSESSSSQDEPDLRLFFDRVRLDNYPDPDPEDWGFPVGSTNQRLFRELQEDSTEYGFDLTVPFEFFGSKGASAKFGYRYVESERDYSEIALGFGRDAAGFGVRHFGDRSAFLADENIGLQPDGFLRRVVLDVTDFIPEYSGAREIDALYAMVDLPISEKFRLITGIRNENTKIDVVSTNFFGDVLDDRRGEIEESNALPSFNFVWSPTSSQNVRLAYSETLARPNFRELSPVAGFSAIASRLIIGNENLELTKIENFDLRWEWFMEGGDLLAASLFLKDLDNPIEQTINALDRQTWQNVDQGEVRGLELEFRKKLPYLSSEQVSFTVGGNLTIIESEVTRPEDELSRKLIFDPATSLTRELQGQSDQILNLDATLELYDKGSTFTLSYNDTGERLDAISSAQLPDVFELPGQDLDFVYSQRVGNKWKIKFKVSNVLAEDDVSIHRFFDDTFTYSAGDPTTKYSFGATYSL